MIINPSTLTNGVTVIPDDDVNIPGPALKFSGTTDAAAINGKLIDSTRPIQVNPSIGGFTQTLQTPASLAQVAFGGQGVQVGDIVYNTTSNVIAVVSAIDSDTTLSLELPNGSGDASTAFNTGSQTYAIYAPNGMPFNNGLNFGFRALVGEELEETLDDTTGYDAAANQPITASGGTILDIMSQTGGTPLTFTLTIDAGGNATICTIATAGKFSANSLVGRTVEFDQTAIRAVAAFGTAGTEGCTFTFGAGDEDFTDRIQAGGQPKAFQIYNGGTPATFNVLTSGGDTVLIPLVPTGDVLPLAVIRVWSAGTTATLGSTIAFT